MFALGTSHVYQLYGKPCDMRKSFNGLSGLVSNELGRDPLSGEVFIFINKNRDLIKLLHWEPGGFVLYYKRLEKGTFTLPITKQGNTTIKWPELVFMIEGIEIKEYREHKRFQLTQ